MHVRTYATIVALGFPFVACQDASRSVDTRPVGPGGPADSAVQRAGPELVPGQYIVVFHSAVTDPGTVATALVSGLGGTMLHIYTSAIKGFAARLPASAVGAIQRNPLVASVEPDQVMRADVTQAMDANGDPWGLDRIDQGALPLSRTYSYTSTGAGVHAYIIDTGIWTLHPEFGGRADDVYNALGITGEDCNGHGTHVAGTVGAATYGVAKGVSLHGVRVLSCVGIGLNSDVIAGVDWVTANHASPAVANMSLGGGKSSALDQAVTSLWNSGVFLAVAAGNDNADACGSSPAGATGVFTVAASEDRRQGVVFQLGHLRRSVRAGVVDQVHLPPRHDHDPERHVDGHTARHGRGRPVQGDLRRRSVGDGVELDHQQCHDECHHGESVGDPQSAAVQVDAVMRN